MKKLLFLILFLPLILSAQLTNRSIKGDTLQSYLADSLHDKSRTRFYRPGRADSTFRFLRDITLGTPLLSSYGGTGLSSLTQGDLLYYNSGAGFSQLGKNTTATRYLSNTGTNNNPAWAGVDLTNGVINTLPGTNGGTNNAYMQFSGPTVSLKTFTLPNVDTRILTKSDSTEIPGGYVTHWQKYLDSLSFIATSGGKKDNSDSTNTISGYVTHWQKYIDSLNTPRMNIVNTGEFIASSALKGDVLYTNRPVITSGSGVVFSTGASYLPDWQIYTQSSSATPELRLNVTGLGDVWKWNYSTGAVTAGTFQGTRIDTPYVSVWLVNKKQSNTYLNGTTQTIPKAIIDTLVTDNIIDTTGTTIYVDNYGAHGDGSTDDISPILSAVAKVTANGGGTLVFGSEKTYAIGNNIMLPSNIIIRGNGATLKLLSLPTIEGILKNADTVSGNSNITIYDLTIDVDVANHVEFQVQTPRTNQFAFYKSNNILLFNCSVKNNFNYGFYSIECTDVTYVRCTSDNVGDAFEARHGNNVKLSNCENINGAYSVTAFHFWENCNNVQMQNCTSRGMKGKDGVGLFIKDSRNLSFTNVYIEDSGTDGSMGLSIGSGSSSGSYAINESCKNLKFVNCTFNTNGINLRIYNETGTTTYLHDDVSFTNCTFTRPDTGATNVSMVYNTVRGVYNLSFKKCKFEYLQDSASVDLFKLRWTYGLIMDGCEILSSCTTVHNVWIAEAINATITNTTFGDLYGSANTVSLILDYLNDANSLHGSTGYFGNRIIGCKFKCSLITSLALKKQNTAIVKNNFFYAFVPTDTSIELYSSTNASTNTLIEGNKTEGIIVNPSGAWGDFNGSTIINAATARFGGSTTPDSTVSITGSLNVSTNALVNGLLYVKGGNLSSLRNEMATWISNNSADGETNFMNNAYYSSGTKRRYADQASRIQFIDGKIVFSTAGYGAANSAITWTDAATIDTTGKTRVDSLGTNKIVFTGVAPPVQSYALGADSANRRLLYTSYQVQRSVDLTHAVITADVLDSNSVRETVLDSVQMAANFPSAGKIVRINLLGNYTLTGSGTCIIRIRHRNGATSDTTGTVLDSLILTNIASDKGLNLIATTTFRTVGATGSAVSFLRAETGTTVVTGGNVVGATTINTTTNNTLYITSKRSVTSDKVKIRQGWAETRN